MSDEDESKSAVTLKLHRDQMINLLQFDEGLRKARGLGVLTPEGRVLFSIALQGTPQVSDTMAAAGTSYRGFFTVLNRLKKASLVRATVDTEDHRIRRLSIGEEIEHEPDQ